MELNFKKLGTEGPEIIILHGLFGMLDNWKTFGRQMSEQYQVYLVDQRDHGRSPRTSDFNYKLLAEDLAEFIRLNDLNPYAIMGHSMGGKTVLQFANDYPDLFDRMIVVDIGPLANEAGHHTIFKALQSFDPAQIEDRSEAFDVMSSYIHQAGVIQFLMKNLSRNQAGGYQWKMNLDLLHEKYEHILAEISFDYLISSPCLFIKGAKSAYIDERNLDHIEEVFSNAEIITIEDAGHWVHAEQGARLLEVVLDFLD